MIKVLKKRSDLIDGGTPGPWFLVSNDLGLWIWFMQIKPGPKKTAQAKDWVYLYFIFDDCQWL